MGVIASAAWALALLTGGALLAMSLERRFLRAAGRPPGPAADVSWREDVMPSSPDPWLYRAGPVLAVLAAAWAILVIPFSRVLVGSDLNIGLFYFLVVMDFLVLGIAAAGWGADTPDAVEACYRAVAQLVSYVVPLGLAVIGPIMMARSLSIVSIVEAQAGAGLWYVVAQPLGFALYLVTSLMQIYRAPFLEPFSEHIHHGVLGAYGGWRAVCWRLALSGALFIAAAMGAALFLGGFDGPLLPGPFWMLLKTVAVLLLMLWAGSRVRLLSTSAMLALAWKVLIPAGLLNVLVVGGLILLGVGQSIFD